MLLENRGSRNLLPALAALACVALPAGARADGLPPAGGGVARYTIAQAGDAAAAERTTARELAEHLAKITGELFPVVEEAKAPRERPIIVGPCALGRKLLGAGLVDGLGPEEFVVRTVGSDLVLVGGRPRGTLYAVYSFLEEDPGCRWLAWWGDEVIPRTPSPSVPALDRREAPAFAVRDIVTHTNGYADKARRRWRLLRLGARHHRRLLPVPEVRGPHRARGYPRRPAPRFPGRGGPHPEGEVSQGVPFHPRLPPRANGDPAAHAAHAGQRNRHLRAD